MQRHSIGFYRCGSRLRPPKRNRLHFEGSLNTKRQRLSRHDVWNSIISSKESVLVRFYIQQSCKNRVIPKTTMFKGCYYKLNLQMADVVMKPQVNWAQRLRGPTDQWGALDVPGEVKVTAPEDLPTTMGIQWGGIVGIGTHVYQYPMGFNGNSWDENYEPMEFQGI